jgi:hypothetical protein
VQHAPEPLVAGEADIFQWLIEASDRPLVHLLVQPLPLGIRTAAGHFIATSRKVYLSIGLRE